MTEDKIILASSKNDNCIRRLFYYLEQKYPKYQFDLHIGYTSAIYNDCDMSVFDSDDIKLFCDGYTNGWEDAIE